MDNRHLSELEILELKRRGCCSEEWDKIIVNDDFNPCSLSNVYFSGKIIIGGFTKKVEIPGGIQKSAGIYNSYIHNCTIGDNCLIQNAAILANYNIEPDVIIINAGSIITEGKSSFGNGVEIEILNEGGGRELKIYDRLSAQIAYLLVLYRHDRELIKNLNSLIDEYVKSKYSERGLIQSNTFISNITSIQNVNIGSHCKIVGAAKLENGSIVSRAEAPVYIGTGVIASKFIIQSGSKVDNFVILDKCFVGQSVTLGKQFSAENSAFFANCEGFHGEAVALFAGPYSVTHHKSTLLIAGLLSFFNAGSGSNQSNHMYKLGPLHQGIFERGSKTGSFSYLLWPSRVGAFSAVIGKHYINFDSSDMPFSYISEENGKSVLTPAMNLLTVGTKRDCEKWPARDKRKDPDKLDIINFDLFNPYIVGKMYRAIKILQDLYAAASKDQEFVTYNGLHINRLMLKTGAKYFEIGIKIFLGKSLMNVLDKVQYSSFEDLITQLDSQDGIVSEWADLCGMLVSIESLNDIIGKINSGDIKTITDLAKHLSTLNDQYVCEEWKWTHKLIESRINKSFAELSLTELIQIINDWKDNSIKLNNMVAKDAMREFDTSAKTGFGIDGTKFEKNEDFESVRGTYEGNKFVKQIITENTATELKAAKHIEMLSSLKT